MTDVGAPAALAWRGRWRPLAAPVGMALLAGAAGVLVATVDPYESGHYPTCVFRMLTGWYCPGCGTLRAAHSLLHGDVAGALDMNVLAVLAIPVVVASWLAWMRRAATGKPRSWLAPPWFVWGVMAVLVAFAALRNLPALAPSLAP